MQDGKQTLGNTEHRGFETSGLSKGFSIQPLGRNSGSARDNLGTFYFSEIGYIGFYGGNPCARKRDLRFPVTDRQNSHPNSSKEL
jgi:hypothetical protein